MSTLSFKAAALKILQESKRSMSTAEIYQSAMEQNLIKTTGETPEATMGAQIYTDIKKNGDSSPFVKVGKGLFAAASTSNREKTPEQIIQEYNKAQKTALKERLLSTDPFIFEHLVGDLLEKLGYENVEVTKRSGDGGVDVKAVLTVYGFTNVKTAVQVKRYSHNVNDSVVRELRGAAETDQRGLIITTADFTPAAKNEAAAKNKVPISLVNGEMLLDLLIKYQVGVKSKTTELISVDEDYFENLESDDSNVSTDKKKAIWPLPGGINHYYESLLEILEALKEKSMSKESLIKWFKTHFENVCSDKTIMSYMSNIFANLALVQFVGKTYRLTSEAESLLKNPSKEKVFEIMKDRIFGIDETLSLIENSSEPVSDKDLCDYLVENFNVNWTTNAQASFRLLWLWNLEKIQRTENGKYFKN